MVSHEMTHTTVFVMSRIVNPHHIIWSTIGRSDLNDFGIGERCLLDTSTLLVEQTHRFQHTLTESCFRSRSFCSPLLSDVHSHVLRPGGQIKVVLAKRQGAVSGKGGASSGLRQAASGKKLIPLWQAVGNCKIVEVKQPGYLCMCLTTVSVVVFVCLKPRSGHQMLAPMCPCYWAN